MWFSERFVRRVLLGVANTAMRFADALVLLSAVITYGMPEEPES
jgi:hypothetical protein